LGDGRVECRGDLAITLQQVDRGRGMIVSYPDVRQDGEDDERDEESRSETLTVGEQSGKSSDCLGRTKGLPEGRAVVDVRSRPIREGPRSNL